MGRHNRFLMQFAISALAAVATPAIAAGIVAGTSVAVQNGNAALTNAVYSQEEATGASADAAATPIVATHGPAKLNVLVGNDDAAWKSARSVHVNFSRKPH